MITVRRRSAGGREQTGQQPKTQASRGGCGWGGGGKHTGVSDLPPPDEFGRKIFAAIGMLRGRADREEPAIARTLLGYASELAVALWALAEAASNRGHSFWLRMQATMIYDECMAKLVEFNDQCAEPGVTGCGLSHEALTGEYLG